MNGFHPVIRDFAKGLLQQQPVFQVAPRSIKVLASPNEFLETLLNMIKRAKSRIFISSLYIGSKEAELICSLKHALSSNPNLLVTLQLDLNRSTRPGETSTAQILLPLLREFPDRIQVSLFQSPHLRGLMAKLVPPRFNEGWGTWHAKVYGVDDQVMISGANLNKSYFTNRQDRYLHLQGHKELAQYCFDFLQKASEFSFHLKPMSSTTTTTHSYLKEDYLVSWPHPNIHPHQIHDLVREKLHSLQSSYISRQTLSTEEQARSNALIFPLIQAGQFGIREEENVFSWLFKCLEKAKTRALLDLTSGYFSLYKPYQELILSSKNVDCRIVASSPEANGFYGSAGLSGRIPEAYTLYEQRFMNAVRAAGKSWVGGASTGYGVKLSEWNKPGWTYHAKGIWLSPNNDSKPILTLFGSTNLNARSAHLDTELSFMMVIPSSSPSSDALELQSALAQEASKIRGHTVEWKGAEREVSKITRLLVRILKGML
ncbi:hypothetical protein FA15DRAFT_586378 [Coprinopsis marcescibilis]|uniref:CDP-diacylglycerol--glycerol-3-phosphate 3-phosphatidyltransferase n=1 Tax=Coprinopsis marcescibilis TaxID=230819 RepID=A0A5C3L4E4_COPMA|nr:hypothetical protein FA15DRAFT_586378 [Coprinopsis marcescibilis]